MGAQRAPRAVVQHRGAAEEVLGQRQDVVAALGQRRQAQLDHVEAVVEVLAEAAVADHRGDVGVGGADDTHRDLARAAGTQALELAALQHAQQLGLARQRQVADLVEEQRAAVGRFEASLAGAVGRACVGTGLRAEQFRLDQLTRQRAAVHRHERSGAHGGVGLDDFRDALLAGTVRTGDEYRNVRTRDLAGELHQPLGGGGGKHQAAQVVGGIERLSAATALVAQARHLARGFGKFQQVLHRRHQLVVVPRLGEVVGGAGLDQFHRGFEVRPGGQQDDRQVRMALADRPEQCHAFLARGGVGGEVHVLHHEVDFFAPEQREPRLG